MASESVYEMLWDCAYCGTRKLLGLTHRYCPTCGAPQDAEGRYFPEEADKVAVRDHEFVGADRECPACEAASSAAAQHCPACGSPLDGAARLKSGDTSARAARAGPRPGDADGAASKWGRLLPLAIGAGVLFALGTTGVLFWTQDVEVPLSGHGWERVVAIERFESLRQNAWCDAMPRDAFGISRSREVRRHDKVADGRDCRRVRENRGDGTFSERQECTTRYREVPVYEMKCHFSVNRWVASRRARAEGFAREPAPYWPATAIERPGDCLGCEREGRRSASYSLLFEHEGEAVTCETDEARWSAATPGELWSGEAGRVLGNLRCNSLLPPASS